MLRKKPALLLTLISIFLTGCAAKSPAQQPLTFRTALLEAGGCSFTAAVTADYGETTADEKIQSLKDNEALSDVTAIKNENFLVITLPEVFASTRVADTIEKFAEAFHPECFE